jgi:hypothetical protein
MNHKNWRLLIIAAFVAFAPTAAHADIHKWVDADGNVHYSDQPPPSAIKDSATIKKSGRPTQVGEKAEKAEKSEGKPEGKETPAANRPPTAAEQEMEFRKRRTEKAEREAKAEKESQEAAERKKNCDGAKGNLARLQRGGLITSTNAQGETVYLGEKEIAADTERARKQVEQACK